MKRWMAIVLYAFAFTPHPAGARSVGVGVFGGASIPTVQDDNGSGSIFGVRVPVVLLPLVTVEPFFGATRNGDATQDIGGVSYTRSGFDIDAFGANVMLTFGGRLQFCPLVGISTNALSRPGSEDQTMVDFNFGLGLGFSPVPKVAVHLRGEGYGLSKDDSGRTFVHVTLGVSYHVLDFAAFRGAPSHDSPTNRRDPRGPLARRHPVQRMLPSDRQAGLDRPG
jgi:hypothetical protein